MDDRCAVVSIIYKELGWADTERCLDVGCPPHPVFFVDRRGIGSLAKAINSGFKQWANGSEYIWFVTNVLFNKDCLQKLIKQMDAHPKMAAITPAFQSDHKKCCPIKDFDGVIEVPFVEFTAPIIRASVFRNHPLNEEMPYWGHDLDWGYRVRQSGYSLGVYHGATLDHVYIRDTKNDDRITKRRHELRRKTNASTRAALITKYGSQWKGFLRYEK